MTATPEAAPTARPFRLELADEIRGQLARRRLSNRKLAAILNVSPPWVDRRLNGHTPMTLDDVELIAGVLNMTAPQLVAGVAQHSITAR